MKCFFYPGENCSSECKFGETSREHPGELQNYITPALATIPNPDVIGIGMALDDTLVIPPYFDDISKGLLATERVEAVGPIGSSLCDLLKSRFKRDNLPRMHFG